MKRHEITTRIGAIILAAGMIVGEAAPALAAEKANAESPAAVVSAITADEASQAVPEDTETEETQTQETEEANETTELSEPTETVGTSEIEEDTQAETEGTQTEEILDVEDALFADEKGVSTVIGLEGETGFYTKTSDDGKTTLKYAYVDRAEVGGNSVWRSGAPVAPDSNGLYLMDGDLYASVSYYAEDQETYYSNNVTDYIIIPATAKPAYNEQTGLYTYNGKSYTDYGTVYQRDAQGNTVYGADGNAVVKSYYINPNDEVVSTASVNVTAEHSWLSSSDVAKAVGKKVSEADSNYSYYVIGGKNYDSMAYHSAALGNSVYAVTVYGTKGSEISFERRYQEITWNPVSNETEVGANGKVYYVGYQVEMDKAMAVLDYKAANGETFTTDSSFTANKSFAVGEQVVYRVRAIYYTRTENATTGAVTYAIVATGGWSDAYAYATEGDKTLAQVPTVTGLKAVLKKNSNTTYDVTWNGVADANGYTYQILYSDVLLANIASISEYTWNQNASSGYGNGTNTYINLNMQGRTRAIYTVTTSADEDADYEYYTRKYYKYAVCTKTDPEMYTSVSQYNPATGKNETVYMKKVYCEASDIEAIGFERTSSDQPVYYKYTEVDTPYAYIRVAARVTYDNEKYIGTRGAYSAPYMVQLNNIAMEKEANVPAISGLKVETKVDGSFILNWNRINDDANVAIFYSTDDKAFADGSYLYDLADAYRKDAEGKTQYFNDQTAISELVTLAGKKVKRYNCSGASSETGVSSSALSLEYGKKYYFKVVTYDYALRSQARQTTPYNLGGVLYTNYTDISAPASVTATLTMGTLAAPATKSESDSITLTFASNSNITGYEIYRSNGKKYVLIATSTSRQYVDSGLKADTTYSYKAVAYNYNPVTKTTYSSEAVFFSAETSTNNYIDVKVTASTKTAAKVTWTKVAGATQYAVYRSNTSSTDNNLSKTNSTGNSYEGLSNSKWTLVKTITKAKTTSLTDKKLTAGETYTYQVVATYKFGKTTRQISDSASITLKISAPKNVQATLSGKKVKVTWTADKYATKYEVRYKVYNAQDKAYNDDWTVKSVKKATYTISTALKNGEYVRAQVRAYDGKKWTEWSSQVGDTMTLAAVKSVKAVNTTVKDVNNVVSSAVKISWKKVSGAAYYQVYRSTSPATAYNADEKVYTSYSAAPIAKESNYDENYNIVYYDDYKGQSNTIVGTSAIDRGQLQAGVTYYYFVVAYAANGTAVSYGISANTSVVFDAVASIKTAKATKGKVTLTLNKTTGATKYVVYRSTKKNTGYTQVGTTKKTSYVDKKVKKGTTYYYKIVATGTNGLKADFSVESAAVKVKAK